MVPLGKRLQIARKKKNITLEQASKALRIRPEFLEALEKGDYKNLPPSAYAHGFVGNYAQYLGLPKNETLAMFRREFDENNNYGVLPSGFTRQSEFKIKRMRIQQTVFFVGLLFLLVGGYILYQYRFAFVNPPLDVYSPTQNEVLQANEVEVRGKTDPNATVFVNSTTVSIDENGSFSKQLSLFGGKTIIKISAVSRFGKRSDIERIVEVKE